MCQKIEDCLLSKIGFRIFISVVFTIVVFALLLNFQILTGSKVNSVIEDTLLKKIKETRKDDRRFNHFSLYNKQNHEGQNSTLTEKTKILLWMKSPKIDENSFYSEFSHRVHRLRRNECPILNECIFASNKNKFHKADAVVIVGDSYQRYQTNDEFLASIEKDNHYFDRIHFHDNNNHKTKNKIWSLLIQDPFEQRNKEKLTQLIARKFGISEIKYLISYMPDADIPLIQFSLIRKMLKGKISDLKAKERLSTSPLASVRIDKLETAIPISSTFQTENVTRGSLKDTRNKYSQNNDHVSNSNASTKYGIDDIYQTNTLNIPIRSFGHYHEQLRNKNNEYEQSVYNKFKKQFIKSRKEKIIRHEMYSEQAISSTQRKRGRSDGTYASNNRRLAAMIMNECTTEGNREAYINEMNKHLTIQIYGKCGAPCPGNTEEDCLEYLSNYYTFILVFETHVCQHFISPQLLRVLYLKKNSMVPVVFGGINYNDLFTNSDSESMTDLNDHNSILSHDIRNQQFTKFDNVKTPGNNILKDSNVFMIDALGQSPSALAHYLKHLAKNRSADRRQTDHLQNYLRWKHNYELRIREWPCALCEKLRENGLQNEGNPTFRKHVFGNKYKPKASELCTSWPKLDFGGSE